MGGLDPHAIYPKDTQLNTPFPGLTGGRPAQPCIFQNWSDVQVGGFYKVPEPRFAAGLIRSVVEICEASDQLHYPIDFVVKHPITPDFPASTLGWISNSFWLLKGQHPLGMFSFEQFEFCGRFQPSLRDYPIWPVGFPGLRPGLFAATPSGLVGTIAFAVVTENLVELTGIEPVTPCLQSRCSPS